MLVGATVVACDTSAPEYDIGKTEQLATVADYFYDGCSTSVVIELSRQIAEEVICLEPDAFGSFQQGDGIVFSGGAVLPYLAHDAIDDLQAAVAARGGELRINSGFRTVVQQYLLRAWYERGRCGITAAAPPGQSNHESGRALDIGNYGEWSGALAGHGWDQTVPGDDVHFDHLASPDIRGYDVLAFQRLWNRNHPGDLIDEDGLYGQQTASRLATSPADGFPMGACGGQLPYDGSLIAMDGPAQMAPGDRAQVVVAIENTGSEAWHPGATFLGTSDPIDRDSELFDPQSWISPNRPATVSEVTEPGEVGEFRFMALAPQGAERSLSESFSLVEEGMTWFGPPGVTLEILLSQEAELPSDSVSGGCQAGEGAGSKTLALLLLATALVLPRRRRSRRLQQD